MADRHQPHSSRQPYVYRYTRAPERGRSARSAQQDPENYYYHRHSPTWHLCTGCLVMVIGLAVYFAGGYLFVSYYNGEYPFTSFFPPYKAIEVKSLERMIYKWIGPTMFFAGLLLFCVGYATTCKGVKCGKTNR